MGIEVTEEAVVVMKRSLELGGIDPATGGIRLRAARALGGGTDVQVELADGPQEGEEIVEQGGVRVFIDPAVSAAIPEAVLTVEPQHEILVVRPI